MQCKTAAVAAISRLEQHFFGLKAIMNILHWLHQLPSDSLPGSAPQTMVSENCYRPYHAQRQEREDDGSLTRREDPLPQSIGWLMGGRADGVGSVGSIFEPNWSGGGQHGQF
jgi:hypothetical protein